MGGYGAAVLANLVPLTSAISVSPRLPPLGLYAAARTLKAPSSAMQIYVVDPRIEKDVVAIKGLSALGNDAIILELPFGGHPATSMLRRRGWAGKAIAELVAERPSLRRISRLHKKACDYEIALASPL